MTNTTANDGTSAVGTAFALLYTAGVNGSAVSQIRVRISGRTALAASGNSTATIARVWINNGLVNTTAANNILLGEVLIPATTNPMTNGSPDYFIALPVGGLNLPAGFRLYGGIQTAVGGTNLAIAIAAVGGDF
jgi:hypothetical protein